MPVDASAIAAAARLSMALGGARVTVDCPLDAETADALAAEIRAGLESGPGPAWAVESLTVTGDPPRVGAVKITVAGESR